MTTKKAQPESHAFFGCEQVGEENVNVSTNLLEKDEIQGNSFDAEKSLRAHHHLVTAKWSRQQDGRCNDTKYTSIDGKIHQHYFKDPAVHFLMQVLWRISVSSPPHMFLAPP